MGGRGASSSIGKGSENINKFLKNYKQEQKKILELYDKYDWTTKNGEQKLEDERFKELKNFYQKYQDGQASNENFFINTMAEFEKTERPNREPDYVSKDRNGHISSRYWYTDEGVIRGSNHWGNGVASCDWLLKGSKQNMKGSQVKYGKAKWSDFVQKPEIIKSNGKLIMSNFNNTIGKAIIYNSHLGITQSVAKIKGIDYNSKTVSKVNY